MDRYNLVSLAGIPVLLAIAWGLSKERRRMNWRLVAWGIGLQLVFGLFVFRVPAGVRVFGLANVLVDKVLLSANAGTEFVFGRLATPPGATAADGSPSLGFILAFQALPTIVFFSALMSILYFIRVMPVIIKAFAAVFSRLMGISGAESLCAASNIFVGVESALVIKPELSRMTRSELCTVLTAGMATVASNVLALYVFCLRDTFEGVAGHFISASILSAPAALVMSKILLPETGKPATLGVKVEPHYERENTIFEAIINGANTGAKLIFGIVALLLAVVGLVALANTVVGGIGSQLAAWTGIEMTWSIQGALGVVFYPFVLITGVPACDAWEIAQLVGSRLILTEVPSYQQLAVLVQSNSLIHPRSAVLATYALCGFAHVAALAIFVGGVTAIAPERAADLSRVGLRALLAANLACLLTACVAGVFVTAGTQTMLGL